MALCMPIHLRQRTSRVYQDHPAFSGRALTSFVPPVHNQGVNSAPNQGLALWKIFLPTTGSFFVFFITDFSLCNSTFQRTFSRYIPILSNPAIVAGFNIQAPLFYLNAQANRDTLCLDMLRFMPQPMPPVLQYRSASSDRHNPRPSSVLHRKYGSICTLPLSRTASFSMDSLSLSCNSCVSL